MTATRTATPTVRLEPGTRDLLLVQDGAGGLRLVPIRRRDPVLARLQHRRLDRRLAAGEMSYAARSLAVRATQLVGAGRRRRLADRWDRLAVAARRASAAGRRPGAIRSRTDAACVELVESVAAALRTDHLVPAQAVALAAVSLGFSAEALERLHTGGDDLLAAAARATLVALRPGRD